MHLYIGTNKHIFTLDYDKYQCLSEIGWITHLWEMTWNYGVQIKGYYEKPNITRENDYSMMDKLIELDIHTDDDLKRINRCRMYLRVQNLSDIVNGSGNKISIPVLHHCQSYKVTFLYKHHRQAHTERDIDTGTKNKPRLHYKNGPLLCIFLFSELPWVTPHSMFYFRLFSYDVREGQEHNKHVPKNSIAHVRTDMMCLDS